MSGGFAMASAGPGAEVMAPEAAKGGEPSPSDAKPHADPPPPLPASPLVVAQHVFPGMAGDFLLPFDPTDAVLRRPWRAGDRVRVSWSSSNLHRLGADRKHIH